MHVIYENIHKRVFCLTQPRFWLAPATATATELTTAAANDFVTATATSASFAGCCCWQKCRRWRHQDSPPAANYFQSRPIQHRVSKFCRHMGR